MDSNKKRRRQGGFTLVEMLAALLIMVLIALITAGGIPLVLNAYNRVVDESDARLLLSTTVTELRNELAAATEINVSADGTAVEYRSPATGAASRISLDSSNGQIMLTRFAGLDTTSSQFDSRSLVSEKAITKNLSLGYEEITFSDGIVNISGLTVYGKDGTTEQCSVENYHIRNITSD